MIIKEFTFGYINNIIAEARLSKRKRQYKNIHMDYTDPCQRLFNAIEPDSYIRPHMHSLVPRTETMIAICGEFALITFDDIGKIVDVKKFGSYKKSNKQSIGVEIPAFCWHTVISNVSGSVLLELKAGPFDPNYPKEYPFWSPEEGSSEAMQYLEDLREKVFN
ncbi:MAG: WbuC family cupin fold metalloprotein [Calditrichaceae bacterium]|nr:WbuC family cupin fold metalloprotein [Calditrichaceae bacterium]